MKVYKSSQKPQQSINISVNQNDVVPKNERKKSGCLSVIVTYIIAFVSLIIYFKSGYGVFWIIFSLIFILYGGSFVYRTNYCTNCEKAKNVSVKKCPYCGHKENHVVSFGVTFFMLALFVLLFLLFSHPSDNADTRSDNISKTPKYKNSLSWSLYEENYMFAVEVDDYNGDIYKAGTYVFSTLTNAAGKTGIYDIYVEDKELSSLSELGELDYEVGGIGSSEIEIALNKGDYVYIIPYKSLIYIPEDVLYMKLKEK